MTLGKIRLHKFVSNDGEVMKNLPSEDLAKDLKEINLNSESLPVQRSLGLYWDLETDSFIFRVSLKDTPFTRRGLLSTVSNLYDPLGFIPPVTIQGKIILRNLVSETTDCDEILSNDFREQWEKWKDSLKACEDLMISRTLVPASLLHAARVKLHTFSDASELAIAAVSYVRVVSKDGSRHTGFVMGKAKVAPKHGTTIPRLELCAAVLAVEVAESIQRNLDHPLYNLQFYSDSKVVLGYINNQTRRFYVYMANRVQRIRKSTIPEQWKYVPTQKNPADLATRPIPAEKLEGQPMVFWTTRIS